ncbi:MAG: glycosyltransferase family 4 protein [Parvularculaceae bacterium]
MKPIDASALRIVKASDNARKVAFVGTFPPERCGIATFTSDLIEAVKGADADLDVTICAVRLPTFQGAFGREVALEIEQHSATDYVRSAMGLNERGVSTINLQHEFGIFGGNAGDFILRFLKRAEAEVVTTLHTVSPDFTREQQGVLSAILERSTRIVVMAERARTVLIDTYGADDAAIDVVPHGVPSRPLPDVANFKRMMGFADRKVLMTFGLIGRGKGLETMIHAMPKIASEHPDALYIILGATHPNIIAAEGELYRSELAALAASLGVSRNVAFVDKYATLPELLDYLSSADIYVTPYLNQNQMTSGTLAYAYALGRPILSTPYWHAAELLSGGRGELCAFGDSAAFAASASRMLGDPARLAAMSAAAYEAGKEMRWPVVAQRYVEIFRACAAAKVSSGKSPSARGMPGKREVVTRMPGRFNRSAPSLGHLNMMTDGVGLLQHAKMNVANRAEGYCVDDNARALLAICRYSDAGFSSPDLARLESVYAAFVQNAWNAENGRFRNFMSYDRKWLEDAGSEDSHGRTLHALASARISLSSADRRIWADWLLHEALPATSIFSSPRALAHTVNALCLLVHDAPARPAILDLLHAHSGFLHGLLRRTATAEWFWFEDSLSYENALLPGALINAAHCLGDKGMMDDARAALSWLTYIQTAEDGWFRPVGTGNFGVYRSIGLHHDQQPIEAYASIVAYAAAHASDPVGQWSERARMVYRWFNGWNDLGAPLLDDASFACYDGLHALGANANQGAESCLAAILSSAECAIMDSTASYDDAPRLVVSPRRMHRVGA